MKKTKSTAIFLSIVLMMSIFTVFAMPALGYDFDEHATISALSELNKSGEYSEHSLLNLTRTVYVLADNDSFLVKYVIVHTWDVGYEFEWITTNRTNQPIRNWVWEFDFTQDIELVWNAVREPGDVRRIGNKPIMVLIPTTKTIQ